MNLETKAELIDRLITLEHEQNRLVCYVSLLDKRQAAVIRQFYFDTCSLEEIADKINVSVRTVYKIKNRAIDQLADMYGFLIIPSENARRASIGYATVHQRHC